MPKKHIPTPSIEHVKQLDKYLGDITGKLDKISQYNYTWKEASSEITKEYRNIEAEASAIAKIAEKNNGLTSEQHKTLDNLEKSLYNQKKQWEEIGKVLTSKVLNAIDKIGKAIISGGIGLLERMLKGIRSGLEDVYELFERWTRTMGEFRNRFGVATKNLGAFGKVARQVEGVFYGLTGQFGKGVQAVGEFMEGLELVGGQAKKSVGYLQTLIKEGTFMSRVLSMSATDVGTLTESFIRLRKSGAEGAVKDQRKFFKEIIVGAKMSNVSTAKFGKEVAASIGFMTSFGRKGREMIMFGFSFAKSMGVSLKAFKEFTNLTDSFEGAVKMGSRLNTVFGTTINSLDLMLEQNPAKRFEMVRKALKDQSIDFENLSRAERDFLSQELKLSEKELAGVLNSGQTLEEFQKKHRDEQAKTEKQQKSVNSMIYKTATTLFSFAQAWDGVTMAVVNLLRPFTDLLGLTKASDKANKSFGAVMKDLFKWLTKLINEVAANPYWKNFMEKLANDAKDLGKYITKITTGPSLSNFLETSIKFASGFYDKLKDIGIIMKDVFANYVVPTIKFIADHWEMLLGLFIGSKMIAAIMNLRLMAHAMSATRAQGAIDSAKNAGSGPSASSGGWAVAGEQRAGSSGASAAKSGRWGKESLKNTGAALGGVGSSLGMMAGGAIGGAVGGIGGSIAGSVAGGLMGTGTPWGIAIGGIIAAGAAIWSLFKSTTSLEKAQQELKNQEELHLGLKKQLKSMDELSDINNKLRNIEIEKERKLIQDKIDVLGPENKLSKDKKEILVNLSAQLANFDEKVIASQNSLKDLTKAVKDNIETQFNPTLLRQKAETTKDEIEWQQAANRSKLGKMRLEKMEKNKDLQFAKEIGFAATPEQKRLLSEYEKAKEEQTKFEKDETKLQEKYLESKTKLQKLEIDKTTAHIKRMDIENFFSSKTVAEKYQEFKKALPQGMTEQSMRQKFLESSYSNGQTGYGRDMLTEFMNTNQGRFASGGIVSRPTRALIGESGPEAVIPLSATARGSISGGRRYGADAVRKLMNFATNGTASSSGTNELKVVAGDVYLDGTLVGRHLVRTLLETEAGA